MSDRRDSLRSPCAERRRTNWLGIPGVALALGSLVAAPACVTESDDEDDAVVIGLLLPFTGSASANAANFERAVLLAADRINEAGGVLGRPVKIVAADSHSDVERSRRSVETLIDAGAVAILGPESPDIALTLIGEMNDAEVAFLSPLVGAGREVELDCEYPWFRMAPSAQALGAALAKEIHADGTRTITILAADTDYDRAFGAAVASRFERLGGEIVTSIEIESGAGTFQDAVHAAIERPADAFVLAAAPRTGATIANEMDVEVGERTQWYLSPLLKTEIFLDNVAPRALEGAVGVAPRIYDRGDGFPSAFRERWLGDEPLEGAYFYYDAMGLLAVALESTDHDGSGAPRYERLREALFEAAAPPGEAVGWSEFDVGLERLRDGDDIYYSGLTGPLLFEDCGTRRLGVTDRFRVEDGDFESD